MVASKGADWPGAAVAAVAERALPSMSWWSPHWRDVSAAKKPDDDLDDEDIFDDEDEEDLDDDLDDEDLDDEDFDEDLDDYDMDDEDFEDLDDDD
jgi:hypothetical protein